MILKKQFIIIFISIFILLSGALFTFFKILENEKQIASAELKRYESYLLADELRQSSDDLTRMARTYTVTKKPRFRQYFNEILEIRDGKRPRPKNYNNIYWDFVTATGRYPTSPSDLQISLESLMKEREFTQDELTLLEQAKKQSDTLVKIENKAMNAMVGLYPNEDGYFVIRKEPNSQYAQKIMHSQEYHRAKRKIMEPMRDFFQKVNQRTFDTVKFYRIKGVRLSLVLLSLISLCLALTLVSVILLLWQKQEQKKDLKIDETKPWKRRLFFIYLSWPLFILMIAAFAINLSFFWWNTKNIEDKVDKDLNSQLNVVVETSYEIVSRWLEETKEGLESLILLNDFSRNQLSTKKERFILNDKLSKFVKINNYKNYFLIDKKSKKILLSDKKKIKEEHLKVPLELLSQLKDIQKTGLIFPTRNKSGKFFSKNILLAGQLQDDVLIVIEIPLDGDFSQLVQKGRFKQSGESYIFNDKADLLSESRFNDKLYSMGLLKKGQSSSLNIQVLDPESKKVTQMIENAFKTERGSLLTPYNDYRGIPVIGSWIWDSEYKIGFTTEIDSKEAFEVFYLFKREAYIQLIIGLALLLILTGIFVWNRAIIYDTNERLKKAYHIMQAQNQKIEDELSVGRQIQMSMVPVHFPNHEHFSIYASLKPARQLGGDFYDFFFLDNKNKLCMVVADVSGKGVPSALFMAVTKTLIRSASLKYSSTDGILSQVNADIAINNPHCMFATMFLSILDLKTGRCEYSNAGHHSSYVKKSTGELITLDELHGPVAGAIENSNYKKNEIHLNSGDILIAYTDGITEAVNKNKTLYGEERLETLLEKTSFKSEKDMITCIVKDVEAFSKGVSQSDDITLLGIRYS